MIEAPRNVDPDATAVQRYVKFVYDQVTDWGDKLRDSIAPRLVDSIRPKAPEHDAGREQPLRLLSVGTGPGKVLLGVIDHLTRGTSVGPRRAVEITVVDPNDEWLGPFREGLGGLDFSGEKGDGKETWMKNGTAKTESAELQVDIYRQDFDEFYKQNRERIAKDDSQFDACFAFFVLHHASDWEGMLTQLADFSSRIFISEWGGDYAAMNLCFEKVEDLLNITPDRAFYLPMIRMIGEELFEQFAMTRRPVSASHVLPFLEWLEKNGWSRLHGRHGGEGEEEIECTHAACTCGGLVCQELERKLRVGDLLDATGLSSQLDEPDFSGFPAVPHKRREKILRKIITNLEQVDKDHLGEIRSKVLTLKDRYRIYAYTKLPDGRDEHRGDGENGHATRSYAISPSLRNSLLEEFLKLDSSEVTSASQEWRHDLALLCRFGVIRDAPFVYPVQWDLRRARWDTTVPILANGEDGWKTARAALWVLKQLSKRSARQEGISSILYQVFPQKLVVSLNHKNIEKQENAADVAQAEIRLRPDGNPGRLRITIPRLEEHIESFKIIREKLATLPPKYEAKHGTPIARKRPEEAQFLWEEKDVMVAHGGAQDFVLTEWKKIEDELGPGTEVYKAVSSRLDEIFKSLETATGDVSWRLQSEHKASLTHTFLVASLITDQGLVHLPSRDARQENLGAQKSSYERSAGGLVVYRDGRTRVDYSAARMALGLRNRSSYLQQSLGNLAEQAQRSAASVIMARNMSHNIGSHVLSRVSELHPDPRLKCNQFSYEGQNRIFRRQSELVRYLRERMDFLADVVSPLPNVPFANDLVSVLLRFFPKVKIGCHERKGKYPTYILDYISAIAEINADRISCRLELPDGMSSLSIALYGGMLGAQALFVIFENLIRNAAKYHFSGVSMRGSAFANELEIAITVRNCKKSGLIEVDIADGQTVSNVEFEGIEQKLSLPMMDANYQLHHEAWGLKEMRIAAAYLRGMPLGRLDGPPAHSALGDASPPLVQPSHVEGKSLTYTIYLPEPRDLLVWWNADQKKVAAPHDGDDIVLKSMGRDALFEADRGHAFLVTGLNPASELDFLDTGQAEDSDESLPKGGLTRLPYRTVGIALADYPNVDFYETVVRTWLQPVADSRLVVWLDDAAAWKKWFPDAEGATSDEECQSGAELLGFVWRIAGNSSESRPLWRRENRVCIKDANGRSEVVYQPAATDIIYDRHAAIRGGDGAKPPSSLFYQSFNGGSQIAHLLGTPPDDPIRSFAWRLLEAGATKVLIIDERIQDHLKVCPDKSEAWSAAGIFVPKPPQAGTESEDGKGADVMAEERQFDLRGATPGPGDPPSPRADERPPGNTPARGLADEIEEWVLQKTNNGADANKTWKQLIVFHLGLLERVAGPYGWRDYLSHLGDSLKSSGIAHEIILTSGRGRAAPVEDISYRFISYSELDVHVQRDLSKLHLVNALFLARSKLEST